MRTPQTAAAQLTLSPCLEAFWDQYSREGDQHVLHVVKFNALAWIIAEHGLVPYQYLTLYRVHWLAARHYTH